jgi:hypothetical protein
MDFIERIWGVSPDGGSGALEMVLVLLPLVVAAVLIYRNRLRSARGKR